MLARLAFNSFSRVGHKIDNSFSNPHAATEGYGEQALHEEETDHGQWVQAAEGADFLGTPIHKSVW
jgi:hypothetical protein